ncbi:MAG: hypothetical protein GF317_23105 [Candidatus Lokiarchaeota archaeon]|nr:hypothetical protein [Candidatus Lokiarchaeota archaeon]
MRKKVYLSVFIACIIIFNILFLFIAYEFSPVRGVLDVDQIGEDYLVTDSISSSPLSKLTQGYISGSRIILLNKYGKPYWIYDNPNDPLSFAHESLYLNKTNTILVVDTNNDRVIEIAIENKSVVWEWNARDINWTKYNSDWKDISYLQNPTPPGTHWTHINHINYVEKRNSVILSIRNFDMLIEVPHNESADEQLIWYFGEFNNHSLLYHQHNPEVLPNGNILVCDSENNRIIEINYTTKEIIWSWNNNGNLRWPRDCDYITSGKYKNSYLITDSVNSRVLVLDPDTKNIEMIFTSHQIVPYEADHVPSEDTFIVGNSFNTQITKYNNNGFIVSFIGIPVIGFILIFDLLIIILYHGITLYKNISKGKSWKSYENISKISLIVIFSICIPLYNILFTVLFYTAIWGIIG